jgi:hypothetical protein
MLLSQTAKSGYIILSGKVKLSLSLFMDIPKYIKTNRIHPQCLTHLDTMLPVRSRNTGIMQLGSLNRKRLAIQKESALPDCEILCCNRQRKNQNEKQNQFFHVLIKLF